MLLTDNAVLQALGVQTLVLSSQCGMDHHGKGQQNNSLDLIWTSYLGNIYSFYVNEIDIFIPSYVKMEAVKWFSNLTSNFTFRGQLFAGEDNVSGHGPLGAVPSVSTKPRAFTWLCT